MSNRKFFSSTLLALVASFFALMVTPVFAQTTPVRAGMPQRTVVAPEDLAAFTCPPAIEFSVFKGNIGDGIERNAGTFRFSAFTSNTLNSEFVRVWTFRTFTFDSGYGRTTLGRPEADSWFDVKVEKPGWIVIRYWIQGASIMTAEELHPSGGAFEGQLALYTNQNGGLCIFETWSVPEFFAISSLGRRLQYGAFGNNASLMFDHLCFWRVPTYLGQNHLAFNQVTIGADSVTWQPLELFLPGTSMRFNIGWLKVTFPTCQ